MQDLLAIRKIEELLGIELEENNYVYSIGDGKSKYMLIDDHVDSLAIEYSSVCDTVFFQLAKVLLELKQLSTLCLHNNQITDISPLCELTQLSVLNLNNNQITDIIPLFELN